MSREELKNKVEKYCGNNLRLRLICAGLFCPDCPLYIKNNDEERCARGDDEVKEILGEVWAESHGYVKKEKIELEKIVVDPSKIGPTITVKDTSDKQLNPDHYKSGKLQVIEQMLIVFGLDAVKTFCLLNAFKYHSRAGLKGSAIIDHQKADWYMRLYDRLKLLDHMDDEKALEVLREFLREEEEKNGRNSD
ncbi:DUF3310 domain-containing protein [uncultured Dubosiella sp.]|uniref:DUF3310 domain-containing protein n=1 Tax=uncultured Dubosiella sp. TaxID=1937011 RepID=UPI00272F5D4C|nr:DUF3310 domain-containing protein [uncultured Dubosiella sp.]